MIAAERLDERLAGADELLCSVAKDALPLAPLDPDNVDEERQRVAREPGYAPRFRYRPQDRERLAAKREQLAALEFGDDGVETFFSQTRDYLLARLELRMHLGDDERFARPLYAPPPDRVVDIARRLLAAPRPRPKQLERPFTSSDQARVMHERLLELGITDWNVKVCEGIAAHNTDPSNRQVHVRAGCRFTVEEMRRLVVHEIDTHVLRAANGFAQPYRIFALGGVPSYLATEEGLAVFNEERMGYFDSDRTRMLAARVVASRRALSAGFGSVYQELREYGFSHDEAFVTATRVKRGLSDTERPGGYIKDHVYLWGKLLLEDYVLSGGDTARLYVGKIALEHEPRIEALGLKQPRYLPGWLT